MHEKTAAGTAALQTDIWPRKSPVAIVWPALLMVGMTVSGARADIGWKPSRTWVFAVGILQWKHPAIYDSFPDAVPNRADRRLIDALRATGIPDEQIVFLVDERTTLSAIRREYRSLLDRTREGDVVSGTGHRGAGREVTRALHGFRGVVG